MKFSTLIIYSFLLALVPGAAFSEEGNGADSVSPEKKPGIEKNILDRCSKLFASSKLDPIRGKFPFMLEYTTDEMRKNNSKPSAAERDALRAYFKADYACFQLMLADICAKEDKARQSFMCMPLSEEQKRRLEEKSLLEKITDPQIKPLLDGKITYAEYIRRSEKDAKTHAKANAKRFEKYSKRYENKIESWLSPSKPNYPFNSPWWGFYNYAISVAKDVDRGKISEREADKLIEDRRLNLNQEIAAPTTPKQVIEAPKAPQIVTLNCLETGPDGKQVEIPLTIDYTNMTVNGYKAEFYDNEIRWSYPANDGSTKFHNRLNRLSGFYSSGSDERPILSTGHCAPATKQF